MNFNIDILSGKKKLDATYDNVDVEITLDDGRVFAATFFTTENIQNLLLRYKDTGECAGGLYFWASEMIIVNQLTFDVINETVLDLINSGELESACLNITI